MVSTSERSHDRGTNFCCDRCVSQVYEHGIKFNELFFADPVIVPSLVVNQVVSAEVTRLMYKENDETGEQRSTGIGADVLHGVCNY